MELLEVALKRSIDWSMRNRRPSVAPSVPENDMETIAMMNAKLSDESHMRAFITHFKIELNDLIGSKSCKLDQTSDEILSFSDDRDSIDTENADPTINPGSAVERSISKKVPIIKIDGKHSGQYDLNGLSDDDERSQTGGRFARANYCSEKRTVRSSRRRSSARCIGAKRIDRYGSIERANHEEDTDGGYGSLNRENFRSDLVQQLNDIKSRLLDMIHEVDHGIHSCLTEDELEAFKRRRDALIAKLDALIDSNTQKVGGVPKILVSAEAGVASSSASGPSSIESTDSNSPENGPNEGQLLIRNRSEINLHSDGYEEQVQVIDYNFRRRASDNSALKSKYSSSMTNQPLVNNSSMTRINFSAGFDTRQPIDFGAMMRDYENSQSSKTNVQTNKQEGCLASAASKPAQPNNHTTQHVPSSSSTSTYSTSSHTSSSSFL